MLSGFDGEAVLWSTHFLGLILGLQHKMGLEKEKVTLSCLFEGCVTRELTETCRTLKEKGIDKTVELVTTGVLYNNRDSQYNNRLTTASHNNNREKRVSYLRR